MAWLRRYERFWNERLDALTAYAEASEEETRRAEK